MIFNLNLKARLHGYPRLINTVESTKVNRVKAPLHGSPTLINTVESTKVNRVKAPLHGSPRLINTVESTKVNRVKAPLHGSPMLINTVESTKVNHVNSSFQRKWSTGLTGEQVSDGQLSFNVVDSLWVTHHRLPVSTSKPRPVPQCRTSRNSFFPLISFF